MWIWRHIRVVVDDLCVVDHDTTGHHGHDHLNHGATNNDPTDYHSITSDHSNHDDGAT
ncbi:MAG: hypothetical protein OEO77_06985 [Acidimicrobiia bacterium]|nr:hypothetical protein [Acidimicrobiia bacterium]